MHLKAVYQKLNRQYSFGLHLVNISIISKRIKLLYWIKKIIIFSALNGL
jgi:hypothetical protein